MTLRVATRTLAGSVNTYVTVLRAQSNRLNRVCNLREFPQIGGSPRGIPWLRMLQHLRMTIRSSLLSSVPWRKVRGSACKMKDDSTFNIQSSSEIQRSEDHLIFNFCSLLWVPVPNHQVSGNDRICKALTRHLENSLGRLGTLCASRSNHLRGDGQRERTVMAFTSSSVHLPFRHLPSEPDNPTWTVHEA